MNFYDVLRYVKIRQASVVVSLTPVFILNYVYRVILSCPLSVQVLRQLISLFLP